ncbi:MAG: BrnT family toxin [Oligoflexia bacterium]|nr:BrnT family toxin [Oligoflexia bacterium]
MFVLEDVTGFEWDDNNSLKNYIKHNVSCVECEEAFFGSPLLTKYDEKHSGQEKRFFLLGRTVSVRKLFIVFTVRKNKIRVISARDMNKKERQIYERTS